MTAQTNWVQLKRVGNSFFKNEDYLKAAAQYSAAIKCFDAGTDDLAILHRYD
jgi:hypothetical protein